MYEILSDDEAERAERFHFERDRNRFIAARGTLRNILSRYLSCAPSEIRFVYQSGGKPELVPAVSGMGELRFNLSHSANAALYAISRGREIGVDIELIRPDVPWEEIATAFFAPGEIAKLKALPENSRTVGFFNCWTRKEAYVKARGEGLSVRLDKFEVSVAPSEPPTLLRGPNPGEVERWSLVEVPLGDSFAGAVAVEGHPSRLRFFTWPLALHEETGWTIGSRSAQGAGHF
jgi:4'-phosphopantetheinyl transferase